MQCRFAAATLAALSVTACTTYAPQPLNLSPSLAQAVPHTLALPSAPVPALRTHRFDPSDGLDIDEVAMLALARNPQLKLKRDELGEARAQAFDAGLLPTPQLALSHDVLTGGDALAAPFSAGLSLDVAALLQHPAVRAAADSDVQRARLELLWQEWQVIDQARLLVVRLLSFDRQQALLGEEQALLDQRYRASSAALARGDWTVDAAGADFAALQGVLQRRNDLQRQALKGHADLAALLDLSPQAPLHLVADDSMIPPVEPAQAEQALDHLATRRPDLLALQWAYVQQEAKVRQAVLAQFPAVGVSFARSRDNSGVYTSGFSLSLTLPLLDHNQGQIAVARATRQRLHDDFEQRVNAARIEARTLIDDDQLIERQLADLQAGARDADALAQRAREAFARHEIEIVQYSQWITAAYDKQIEITALRESQQEQRIGLQALLGTLGPLPAGPQATNDAYPR